MKVRGTEGHLVFGCFVIFFLFHFNAVAYMHTGTPDGYEVGLGESADLMTAQVSDLLDEKMVLEEPSSQSHQSPLQTILTPPSGHLNR